MKKTHANCLPQDSWGPGLQKYVKSQGKFRAGTQREQPHKSRKKGESRVFSRGSKQTKEKRRGKFFCLRTGLCSFFGAGRNGKNPKTGRRLAQRGVRGQLKVAAGTASLFTNERELNGMSRWRWGALSGKRGETRGAQLKTPPGERGDL